MSGTKDRIEEKSNGLAGNYEIPDAQRFAVNIARAMEDAGKAASIWLKTREENPSSSDASGPYGEMLRGFARLTQYWAENPHYAMEAQTRLFSSYMAIWFNSLAKLSDSQAASAPQSMAKEHQEREKRAVDKRFSDPEWSNNPFFDFLKQIYLATVIWAEDLVENSTALDESSRRKARFFIKQIADAFSPSNFLLTNPQVLRETFQTSGDNLVRGMKMLVEDMVAGEGELKIRHTDSARFELGRNIATTPGKVVARNRLVEVIQYAPTTSTVIAEPLLIVPPWINKFYILDLNKQKSLIRWAVEQGHTVFAISWVNPDHSHADCGWDEYMSEGIEFALDTIQHQTGHDHINAIGYCIGGTLLAATLAAMAQEGDERVKSATFLASQVDYTHAGDLLVFINEDQINDLEREMKKKGFLNANRMATAFNMLRSQELIWSFAVNNYLRGRQPLPFDLLYWNADSTRMTAANHSYYLRNCYLENNLSRGRAKLRNRVVRLSDIKIPIYNLATVDDHISPPASVFHGSRFFGGPVEYVLAGSGHIAGVINPPSLGKYRYWTARDMPETLDAWRASATEHSGSWWLHWQSWIEARSPSRVPARDLGHKEKWLGDAPGDYARMK